MYIYKSAHTSNQTVVSKVCIYIYLFVIAVSEFITCNMFCSTCRKNIFLTQDTHGTTTHTMYVKNCISDLYFFGQIYIFLLVGMSSAGKGCASYVHACYCELHFLCILPPNDELQTFIEGFVFTMCIFMCSLD